MRFRVLRWFSARGDFRCFLVFLVLVEVHREIPYVEGMPRFSGSMLSDSFFPEVS